MRTLGSMVRPADSFRFLRGSFAFEWLLYSPAAAAGAMRRGPAYF